MQDRSVGTGVGLSLGLAVQEAVGANDEPPNDEVCIGHVNIVGLGVGLACLEQR
jgi:hypothetical protein